MADMLKILKMQNCSSNVAKKERRRIITTYDYNHGRSQELLDRIS
jgi:hypothetical protein